MISKLSIVGGSSPAIVDFFYAAHRGKLEIDEVCLIARHPEKLAVVAQFCRRYCDELGYRTRITEETDLRRGLEGTEYVLNKVKIGGEQMFNRSGHIFKSLGFQEHARLIASAVTNLREMHGIGEAVLAACPQAWMIQYSNPCGIITESLMRHYPDLKVLSGCPEAGRVRRKLGALLGRQTDTFAVGGFEMEWVGFNHCAWILSATLDGQDAMPELIEKNDALETPLFNSLLARETGCIWSRHAAEFTARTYMPEGDYLAEARNYQSRFNDRALLEAYADKTLKPSEVLANKQRVDWYEGCVVGVLQGLSGDTPTRYYCSMPSSIAAPSFPGFTVECAVTVQANSVRLVQQSHLPTFIPGVAALVRSCEELMIEASLAMDRKKFVQAMALHPATPGLEAAEHAADLVVEELGIPLS
jgi:6-phospho-beta-glucosidase